MLAVLATMWGLQAGVLQYVTLLSAYEKAITYVENHRELLGNYMLDGRCEISNNRAERQAKSYGTGRKNFLFHNSVNGAKSSAVIYSLVETAKANHLNI